MGDSCADGQHFSGKLPEACGGTGRNPGNPADCAQRDTGRKRGALSEDYGQRGGLSRGNAPETEQRNLGYGTGGTAYRHQ